MPALRLGTRGSALARRQADIVAQALAGLGRPSETVVVATSGDRDRSSSLLEIGGQGVFARQIEEELREGRIDVAVHSAKDVPTALLPGTALAAALPRADVRDALVSRKRMTLALLAAGATVATGSRRRVAQLRATRPDLVMVDVRGNVDTRLRKLEAGDFDALMLAAAGLDRLGRGEAIRERLPIDLMLPAPGQGVILLQTRSDDADTRAALRAVDHAPTMTALRAERAVLAALGAGCSLPVAALGHVRAGEVTLVAKVLDMAGRRVVTARETGPVAEPEAVGRRAGESLLARGAEAMLREPVSE